MRVTIIFLLILLTGRADNTIRKRMLTGSMIVHDIVKPPFVTKASQFLKEGIVYGRLRCNSFVFQEHNKNRHFQNHSALGLGGSLIYKSARWNGLGLTAGFYVTQNLLPVYKEDLKYYKAGKGVFSRYDFLQEGKRGIVSLSQSYVEYSRSQTSVKAGRQIFESFFTKSNDTKMIPNSFEGLTIRTDLGYSCGKAAWLIRQKLRDHSRFHHILAYDGWKQNDDGAMHKGLLFSKLKALHIKDRLFVLEFMNKKRSLLQWMLNMTTVPEVLTLTMAEGSYTFGFGNSLYLTPALRYIRQVDNGAGKIGGANLRNNTVAYKNADSVNSSLYAVKMDLKYKAWKLRLGYTKVSDKADLIAPWRGFPTGGFTRAMGQYNWYADTKTYMIRGDYDLDKAGVSYGTKVFFRYAIQDFDDAKPGVQADSRVLTFDIVKNFKHNPGFYTKIRVAFVNGKNDTIASDGTLKPDPSYHEFRMEMNYLF